MINFIICEDNDFFSKRYCDTIDKVMMKNNLEYKKHIFFDADDDFCHIINENIPNKIYILDMVLPKTDGIEIAEKIRKTDLESLIIFITLYYDDYENDVITGNSMFLKFINKSSDYQKLLEETLENAIKTKNNKILTINTKDTIYRFNPTNVTYINYDKNSRKTYINFIYNNKIPCNLTLKKLQKLLGKNYILTKSCCIVNVEQIYNIDKVNKVITFNNGIQINMLSKNGLKQLLEYIKEQ